MALLGSDPTQDIHAGQGGVGAEPSRSPFRFPAAGLACGGRCDGPPGLRPDYHPEYHAAFLLDPDGNRVEAVCHRPPKADAAVVEFYFGLGSRYSYLASTQLAALTAETGAAFDWLPVDSAKLIRARGRDPFASLEGSGQYDWGYRRRDAEAWAGHYGVPFRKLHGRLQLDPDLLSRACVLARRQDAVKAPRPPSAAWTLP